MRAASSTSSATGTRPSGAETCAPCTRPATAVSISREIRTPSARASWGPPRPPPRRRGAPRPWRPPGPRGEHRGGAPTPRGRPPRCPAGGPPPHPLEHGVGDRHPGHLVGQELGVPERDQRPDPRDDRDPELLHPGEEPVELVEVEDRLGDGELRPRVHLPGEAPELALEVGGGGVHAHADHE